jgi:hypothetical protein
LSARIIMALAAAALAGGCTIGGADVLGGDAASFDSGFLEHGDTGAGGPSDAGAPDGGPADAGGPLAGAWAQLQAKATIATLPYIGDEERTTYTVLRLTIAQDAGAIEARARVCEVVIDDHGGMIHTIVPPQFIAAIPESRRPWRVDDAGAFTQDLFTEVFGAELDDPVGDPLPVDAADPRVVDLEGDGHPGATVYMTGSMTGEVYVVQRNKNVLRGQVTGDDAIDGLLEATAEQVILGSDNQIFVDNQPTVRPDPDPAKSWFKTTRIDPALGCGEILAQKDALFAR